ncbi:MAG: STAS domain-containing protein [Gammaproteobacteria bacterium]|jgi:phospholipid transport system transporter-binding protein|nr:STAS domain-containing protein [Gammaproteobacteria bacterium]
MSSRHPASTEIRPDPARPGAYLIGGELGFSTVPDLLERGRAIFEGGSAAPLELDLSGVTRVDSAGLALLIEWLKVARRTRREISYVNVPEQMVAMARVSGLENFLPLEKKE